MKGKITKESNKVYFNPGDIVYFKGSPEFEQYPMIVKRVEFLKDEEGKYVRKENGNKIPIGVLVLLFPEVRLGDQLIKGEPIEKIEDSRRLYKKEFKATYYLQEVKKIFLNEGKTELIELVNKILDKI